MVGGGGISSKGVWCHWVAYSVGVECVQMLEAETWSVACDLNEAQTFEVFRGLEGAGFKSASWAMLDAVGLVADLKDDSKKIQLVRDPERPVTGLASSQVIASDIFVADDCVLHAEVRLFDLFGRHRSVSMYLTAAFRKQNRPAAVDTFIATVTAILRNSGHLLAEREFDKYEPHATPESLDKLSELEAPSIPSKETIIGTLLLAEPDARSIAKLIKQKGRCYEHDLVGGKGGSTPKVDPNVLEKLKTSGILQELSISQCKTHSKEECFECGPRPADARTVKAAAVTPLGTQLLTKSHWMQVLAVMALLFSGVPRDSIRVPPPSAGSDVIDLLFAWDGSNYLVELKDDYFEETDALLFAKRLRRTTGVHGGIVSCTSGVKPEARLALEEDLTRSASSFLGGGSTPYYLLEGEDCAGKELGNLLARMRAESIARRMELHGPAAGINPFVILLRRIGI